MQYHPHGDASIGDALVVLANKRYLIEGQGNFGNIYTGDLAAAPRYIECRLTELARTEVFNDEITEFVPSYDGRNKEPVTLPSKLPLLLMLGTEGIAVGMSSRILPHNFPELLEAQIAILKKQPFKCLPDFQTGGLMDARGYKDGAGRNQGPRQDQGQGRVHGRHQGNPAHDHHRLADRLDRGRLAQGQDQGEEHQRFHVGGGGDRSQGAERRQRGAVGGCAVCVHRLRGQHHQPHGGHQGQPAGGDDRVGGAAGEHGATGGDAQARAGIRETQLQEELHFRTLERIFIEERIYKTIEQCKTNEAVVAAVQEGFKPFRRQLIRELTDRGRRDAAGACASAASRCSTSTSTARRWRR